MRVKIISSTGSNGVGADPAVFADLAYINARAARLKCIWNYFGTAVFRGARVLELGCGTGDIGAAFEANGASVVSIDARPEFVRATSLRYPGREMHCLDLNKWDGRTVGTFDYVVALGLLYHLSCASDFIAACTRAAPVTILETVVVDCPEAVCWLVDEAGPDQAWSGQGCRPSLSWLVAQFRANRCDLQDISSPVANWDGQPGSIFDWQAHGTREWQRDGKLLRRLLVARSHDGRHADDSGWSSPLGHKVVD